MNKIITGFPTPQKDYYKVYAITCTYNQAPYIEDCLNGVVMQQTDFPFVHHVIDDASTDGEQDVIKAWIEKNCDLDAAEYYDNDLCTITLAKAKNNPNYTIAAYFLKKNMYGNPQKDALYTPWQDVCPYEALCEGDDYWTDPKKLQKQVDFLDANPNYVLVHTAFDRYLQKKEKIIKGSRSWPSGDVKYNLISGNYNIGTLTTMVRVSALTQTPKLYKDKNFRMGDLPIWIELSIIGKIKFLEDATATYRVLSNSAAHNKDLRVESDFINSVYEVREFYAKEYGVADINFNSKKYTSLMKLSYFRNSPQYAEEVLSVIRTNNVSVGFKCYIFYFAAKCHIIGRILHYFSKGGR